jgi:hypothetical protein
MDNHLWGTVIDDIRLANNSRERTLRDGAKTGWGIVAWPLSSRVCAIL